MFFASLKVKLPNMTDWHSSPEVYHRGSNSIIFSCVTSFFFMAGALFIAFRIVFCLSKSLVFSLSNRKSSSRISHSSSLFDPLAQLPRSSSTVCVSDSTIEPGVHTWVSRRLCQLTPSDWMPPPSPYVMGSSTQIGHYRSHQRIRIRRQTKGFTHGKPISASRPIYHPLMCL